MKYLDRFPAEGRAYVTAGKELLIVQVDTNKGAKKIRVASNGEDNVAYPCPEDMNKLEGLVGPEGKAIHLRGLGAQHMLTVDKQAREFMEAMDQQILPAPGVPEDKTVRLRAELVVEECLELLEATFELDTDTLRLALKFAVDRAKVRVKMPDLVDALADIDYVVAGARAAFGVDGEPVANAVHAANMAKLGGPVRADGKRLKPEGWKPADIEAELKKQGWHG